MAEKAVPQKNLAFVDSEITEVKKKQLEEVKLRQTFTFDEALKASLVYFRGR